MSIPSDVIETVRGRASLAEIVGERVTLKRSGKNLSGLCPFHAEKTPSFFVNEEEGFYHCFGCGKKGSAFDFVMETRGFTFPEAVRYLAEKVGVPVPEVHSSGAQARELVDRRKRLRAVVAEAVAVYHRCLVDDKQAQAGREYLTSRGISVTTAERFRLGFAPEREQLFAELQKNRSLTALCGGEEALTQALKQTGLLGARRDGSYFELFHGRVIFPITRSDGAPIACGGRIVSAAESRPKYINSSESPIYAKRKVFFGLSSAIEEIRRRRSVFVVEGYLDVLSMAQAGFLNTVATCGTALTPDHVLLLKRFADSVTIVFDGDAAGVKAAASSFEIFLNSGIDVQAVVLPAAEDPSSLIEHGGREALEPFFVEARRPIFQLFLEHLLQVEGVSTEENPAAQGKIARRICRLLSRVNNPVEREVLTRQASTRLGVSESALEQLAGQERKPTGKRAERPKSDQTSGPPRGVTALSGYLRQLLVAVVCEPALAETVLDLPSLLDGPAVAETIPPSIRDLLRVIAEAKPAGIGLAAGVQDEAELDRAVAEMRLLLERFGLPTEEILQEAIRQQMIGGAHPHRLIQDAPRVTARESLDHQVERLRQEEGNSQDSTVRKELLQEKLLRRRTLRQLMNSPGKV